MIWIISKHINVVLLLFCHTTKLDYWTVRIECQTFFYKIRCAYTFIPKWFNVIDGHTNVMFLRRSKSVLFVHYTDYHKNLLNFIRIQIIRILYFDIILLHKLLYFDTYKINCIFLSDLRFEIVKVCYEWFRLKIYIYINKYIFI